MLVVIAIIGVLAALIFPVTRTSKNTRRKSVVNAELNQVQTAIESYNAKFGFYPPDNGVNPALNQLYFELSGTTHPNNTTNVVYTTLDGASAVNASDLSNIFGAASGITGFMNSSVAGGGAEDTAPASRFVSALRPNQIGQLIINNGSPINGLLVCSVGWSNPNTQPVPGPGSGALVKGAIDGLNPWRYISNNATNNPGSFDLWVDIIIDGKTNRISNWSTTPQLLP